MTILRRSPLGRGISFSEALFIRNFNVSTL
jgi:hypothetical protein